VKIWEIATRSEIATLTGHSDKVRCLAVHKTGRIVASGSEDKTVKVWNISEKKEECSFEGHTNFVIVLEMTPDGVRLVSGSDDGSIKIWNLVEKKLEHEFRGEPGIIKTLTISPDGAYLYVAEATKKLKAWKMCAKTQLYNTSNPDSFTYVFTPDQKVCMCYSRGFLDSIVDTSKNSEKQLPQWGISETFDPYYQNLLAFYNAIDSLQDSSCEKLSKDGAQITFSQFQFTPVHVLCLYGRVKELRNIIGPSFSLRADAFGKSPIFYAIEKQHQECVDILLDFLNSTFENPDSPHLVPSLYAIRNDLSQIIRNSSKRLHLVLKNCLVTTNIQFGKVAGSLPRFQFSDLLLPSIMEFEREGNIETEQIPVVLQYLPFQLPITPGSKDCIELYGAIMECSNKQIYRTPLIQFLIQIQWNALKPWTAFFTTLLFLNLIFMVLLFMDVYIYVFLPLFLLVNGLLCLWEIVQFLMSGIIDYFSDFWNTFDIARLAFTIYWVVLSLIYSDPSEREAGYRFLTWSVAFLNFARGLSAFRLFDGTRYYVRLILRAMGEMRFFIIMLFYSTIAFGVMFSVSRTGESFSFKNLWMDSYRLNFGSFDSQDDYELGIETLGYMLATLMNVILMLNLLISLLGDSYEQFQLERQVIDYTEKVVIIQEIQQMIFWAQENSQYSYFHIIATAYLDDEAESWEGRLLYMDKKFEKHMQIIGQGQLNSKKEFLEKLKLVDSKIEGKLGVTDSKIEAVDLKITKNLVVITKKIQELDAKLNTKIHGVEEKLIVFDEKINSIGENVNRLLDALLPKPK
jgi:WD40 repeat protein